MTSGAAAGKRTAPIHKKTYFDASPTWNTWNKLTARDVFALTEQPGFEGQNVYFSANHPIRYIYLCGIVQQVDLAPGAGASKFALLSLDDGSGSTIEVKIARRHASHLPESEGSAHPSNTLISNLDVNATWGLASLSIDKTPIPLGTILKVKGTLTKFRQQRQVDLKRVFVVRDTNEEVAFWAAAAKHRDEVLARPWTLTEAEVRAVDEEIELGEQREKALKLERREKVARYKERKAQSDEKRERRRRKARDLLDRGALVGSDVIRAPWE